MIYLSEFYFPSQNSEANYLAKSPRAKMTCYDSFYPFGLFAGRGLKALDLADVTILYGGNGSGKSTLAKLSNGILFPQSGQVIVDGTPLTQDEDVVYNARRKVGMVFQNPDNQIVSSL